MKKILEYIVGRRASAPQAPGVETQTLSAEAREAGFMVLMTDLLKERRAERNWRNIKRILISGSGLIIFAIYVFFYVTSMGYRFMPNSDIVGVVRIKGAIDEESRTASANAVIPALAKAFGKPNVKAVVLAIDSGGGKPGESERIINYIDQKRKETGKPVIAVIGNAGASAAYMIAAHCDKIYAGRYSLVGSIGAILQSWNFSKIAEKYEIERKTFASGSLKGMLDPFAPATPEADAKASALVSSMGKTFAREIKEIRGDKLKSEVDYTTGEVWNGEDAKELGLVDELNTLDVVIKQTWGIGYYDFGPTKSGDGFLPSFGAVIDLVVESLTNALLRNASSQAVY